MMLTIAGGRPARLVVLAYDIGCPRRAQAVRRALDPLHHAKQYSVFEAMLGEGEFRGLLTEIADSCDFSSDLLAAWWPLEGLRLRWHRGHLVVGARNGEPCGRPVALPPHTGNFIVCYDISDIDALQAVARQVAAKGAMVQRSVYWLRVPVGQLSGLLERCAAYLADGDRLWAYPLRASHDLWHVGSPARSILPIATYRWRSP